MIVVRYQSLAANAVLTHRFDSVQRPPLRCDGTRAGIKRGPPLRIFPALFNLFGLTKAARSLFRALYQPSKQTSRVFAVSFRPGPFVVLAHGNHHDAGAQGNAQKVHGEIQNVEC